MKILNMTCIALLLVLVGFAKPSSGEEPKRKIDVLVSLDQDTDLDIGVDRNSSYISIGSLPAYQVEVAKNVDIPVTIYRGVTLKRTVYIWVEDSGGDRVSSKVKFTLPTRFLSYNLSAGLNFSECGVGEVYKVIAEGLDTSVAKEVVLEFINCSQEIAEGEGDGGKLSFSVIESAEVIKSGIPFTTRIFISNPTAEHLEVDAWSYLYRSSKCYSGEREGNMKTVNVPEFSNITFDLVNTANAPEGDYNLKIKLLRSGMKTPKEMTLPIKVESDPDSESSEESETASLIIEDDVPDEKGNGLRQENESIEKRSLFSFFDPGNKISDGVLYESSSAKARRLTVYFLILVLALVLVALILKRL